jgi:hypothetical protein
MGLSKRAASRETPQRILFRTENLLGQAAARNPRPPPKRSGFLFWGPWGLGRVWERPLSKHRVE